LAEEDLHPLEGGRYYLFQLKGCSVTTKDGAAVGSVEDIFFVEGNDLLVVEKDGRKILIPFSESICVKVNLEERKITIDPPGGLLDLDDI
jgi:16S rRNA processing protein RimM